MNRAFTLFVSTILATGAWAQNTHNGHEYVDLGLTSGTMWATCNVGADAPEKAGFYYAWGETETKENYNWSTYKWCKGSDHTQTKYVPQSYSSYGYESFYDDKVTLEKVDDVAQQTWGGSWVVPTLTQQEELRDECYWVWTNTYNRVSVNGYIVYKAKKVCDKGEKVTSISTPSPDYDVATDAHIFLPAAGYRLDTNLDRVGNQGLYWSCLLSASNSSRACRFDFGSGHVAWGSDGLRYLGFPIRPVYDGPDTTPTAIESINTDNAGKVTKTIENGQIIIIRNNKKYDLSGREL